MQPGANRGLLEGICHVMQQQPRPEMRRVLEDLATDADCVSQYKDLRLTTHDDGNAT